MCTRVQVGIGGGGQADGIREHRATADGLLDRSCAGRRDGASPTAGEVPGAGAAAPLRLRGLGRSPRSRAPPRRGGVSPCCLPLRPEVRFDTYKGDRCTTKVSLSRWCVMRWVGEGGALRGRGRGRVRERWMFYARATKFWRAEEDL